MALILGLREGDEFEVGQDRFRVGEVLGKYKFTLVRGDGKEFTVTPRYSVEVADDVFITVALQPQNGVARVAIDAPRELHIKRPYYRQEAAE
jgi:hypothetical protein